MRSSVILSFLVFLFLAVPLDATKITVKGSITSTDCGGGLHTFTATHTATISAIDPQHLNRNWNLQGEMKRCGFFGTPVGTHCLQTGNTSGDKKTKRCQTETDLPCRDTKIQPITRSTVINAPETAVSSSGTCFEATNCVNPSI